MIIITANITPYLDFGHASRAILYGILFLFSSGFILDIFNRKHLRAHLERP